MTDIVLLGRNGQVGRALVGRLHGLGGVVALGRGELDLANADAIRATLRQLRPRLLINAAAYTAVDDAETHGDQAMAVNSEAPRVLSEELRQLGGQLIHYSTDYVFDGTASTPYSEDDTPNPRNVYGASKLAGERAIAASGVAHLILRTSWVYSETGRNFVTTIANLARAGKELRVVTTETGSPTWATTLAATTRLIIERCGGSIAGKQGIYHVSAAGATTRFELAAKIVELLARDDTRSNAAAASVAAASAAEFQTAAARPAYSVLSNAKSVRHAITMLWVVLF